MIIPFKQKDQVRVTYPYGIKNSRYASGKHDGIDLVCDSGDLRIASICKGTVIRADDKGAWGKHVVVQGESGWCFVYAHMSDLAVHVGDKVKFDDVLGVMGNTGNSHGAHLHLEIQKRYYKPGATGDIAFFLGIKNEVGKVQAR